MLSKCPRPAWLHYMWCINSQSSWWTREVSGGMQIYSNIQKLNLGTGSSSNLRENEFEWVKNSPEKNSPQRSVSFSHVGHGPWFPSISALRSVSVSHIFTALSATKLSTTAPLYSHHFREILQINFSRILKTIGYRNPKLCQTFLIPPQGHT